MFYFNSASVYKPAQNQLFSSCKPTATSHGVILLLLQLLLVITNTNIDNGFLKNVMKISFYKMTTSVIFNQIMVFEKLRSGESISPEDCK